MPVSERRPAEIRGAFRISSAHPSAALLRAACAALCLLALGMPRGARADGESGPDTLRARFEVGGSTDLTNEQYYDFGDSFTDTTFVTLSRRLVSSPETRYAAVATAALEGTRSRRSVSYQLLNDLSAGDKVVRDALSLAWRVQPSDAWRLQLSPRAEYRRDRSFDRDLEELRASLGARLRHRVGEEGSFLEWGAGGDLLRTHGQGAAFFLDRNAAQVMVAFDRAPLFGDEWRIGYGLAGRTFPDSAERNHFEHSGEGRWAHAFGAGHSLVVEAEGERRVTVDFAPTSRDNFWAGRGSVESALHLSDEWSALLRFEAEAQRYDVQDSSLFFDYQVLRARAGPRFDRIGRWSLRAGPRGELLLSALNPVERYREIGGFAEFEYLGAGSYWSVSPEAGWRAYPDHAPAGFSTVDPGIHSAYAFYELDVIGDQALPGGLRLRAITTMRLESHTDNADDARSLYFSCDLRKLF